VIAVVQLAPALRTPSSAPAELERLGAEIAELAAHIHAATWQLLARLAEFDRLEGWGSGFLSCAHWLSWRTGIAPGAAREKVRVARALESLPKLSDAMRHGRLSYAKVRAVTRVATPENEAQFLELALHGTAAQMEKIVRAWRRADRIEEALEERERHEHRKLDLWIDDDGSWVVRGRLDPEVGAVLMRAIDAAAEALYGRRTDPSMSAPQRRADAIGLIAEQSLANGATPVRRADRFRVVLHVDGDALRADVSDVRESRDGRLGHSVLDGQRVSAETSRRLACDAAVTRTTTADDDTIRSRTRTIPPAIRRALEQRDRGCRFPGCGLRFCDAHHVQHWADGGATRLDNLVLLCRRHHRAVHEDGFRVVIDADGDVAFHTPWGGRLPDAPASPVLHESLAAKHQDLGITPETTTPLSSGQRFDLHWTIAMIRPSSGPLRTHDDRRPGALEGSW
jgi:hypothetical protein